MGSRGERAEVRAVFDTNILIDLLHGIETARAEVKRHEDVAISPLTWMEVLVGTTPAREKGIRHMLSDFRLIPLTDEIAEQAVLERRRRRIKLPEAIILATAIVEDGVLITRNTRDFPKNERHVRIPYRLPMH